MVIKHKRFNRIHVRRLNLLRCLGLCSTRLLGFSIDSVRFALLISSAYSIQAVAQGRAHLRLISPSSFDLSPAVMQRFEQKAGVKVTLVKAGATVVMLNKLILTRSAPIADVVLGLDHLMLPKARQAGLLVPYRSPAASHTPRWLSLGADATPISYGIVAVNYDQASLAASRLRLPTRLEDFALPLYRGQLVIEHPAASSVGAAFLVATVTAVGEPKVWEFWARMRDNGLIVAESWTQAYYKNFSRHGGKQRFVVSYDTSPAAEAFFQTPRSATPPTAALGLPAARFLQIEGAAILAGTKQPALARAWIDYLLTLPVQADLSARMWVYPARPGALLHRRFSSVAPQAFPAVFHPLHAQQLKRWIERWTEIVIRGRAPR